MKALPAPRPTQLDAAVHRSRRLLIEAGPGTGKTFTAAERFGYLAYDGQPDRIAGVLVLSFTVGATQVIRRAIARRWGGSALAWPNRVRTIDSVFRSVLNFLLRKRLVAWPGGHLEIDPLDERRGARRANEENTIDWFAGLDDRSVVPVRRTATRGDSVVTSGAALRKQLEAGECSHGDIRGIVCAASQHPDLLPHILEHLARMASSVLVDEAFDANSTDIALLHLLDSAGCTLSLVGDPWQALYGFRDEVPADLDVDLLRVVQFDSVSLTECFRFAGVDHQKVMAELRDGLPCPPATVTEASVVLAAEWKMLWDASPSVLPLSFGRMGTQLDALVVLLLDFYARNCGLTSARLVGSACSLLGVDAALLATPEAVAEFGAVLALVKSGDAGSALDRLSAVPREVFEGRKASVGEKQYAKFNPRLDALAARLRHGGPHIPGLTVHQAKGDEWDHVGIVMTDEDVTALGAGLDRADPEHRRLYVAMTRARVSVGRFEPA
ncbi:MAG: UvrD-helicase domain-containing protein [Ilumatobacter sp.]|uniref:UvrD-helicase domain-containing protein n=1 Tax=Ilumatobacter sp. TaxID=1967498 RepID=UPI00391CB334